VQFVRDVTIPDGHQVDPKSTFEKTWLLRAPEGLPEGTSLVFLKGRSSFGAASASVPVKDGAAVPPGEFEVTVSLRAPKNGKGKQRSLWRLQSAGGHRFGPRIWAEIIVVPPTDSAAPADMNFVADITIDDGSLVSAGSSVKKTWRVGTKNGWGTGVVLRSLDTNGPYAGIEEAVPPAEAGSEIDVSVTLTAPDSQAHVRSNWGLFDADGTRIGDKLWIDFVTDFDAEDTTGGAGGGGAGGGGAGGGGDGKNDGAADASHAAVPLLEQILAGINIAPPQLRSKLSDFLYQALDSGEFQKILKALAAANIAIE